MALPAAVMTANALIYMGLSPALILGWGPFPPLGIAGAAVPSITAFGLGALALMGFLLSGRSLVRPTLRGVRLRGALFWDILRIGAPDALNTVLTNLTFVVRAGLVSPFRATSLGYGMGARLKYLMIPLMFGLGSMVGTNVGAGHIVRAEHVAWVAAGIAAAVTGTIGLLAAIFPGAWLGLFSADRRAGLRRAVSQHRRPGLRLLRCRPGPLLRVPRVRTTRLAPNHRVCTLVDRHARRPAGDPPARRLVGRPVLRDRSRARRLRSHRGRRAQGWSVAVM
jgi:Na+-driven multidrug efflux pump